MTISRECSACDRMFDGTIDDDMCDYCEGFDNGHKRRRYLTETAREECALLRAAIDGKDHLNERLRAENERLRDSHNRAAEILGMLAQLEVTDPVGYLGIRGGVRLNDAAREWCARAMREQSEEATRKT